MLNTKTQCSIFDLKIASASSKKNIIKNIKLNLIGKYNVLNAAAAISVSLNLGVKVKIIKNALKNFSGVQRRLTKIFNKDKKEFYDDYAHHPTEIFSVLEGLRQVHKKRKIISIFQPHRYSRVKCLKKEFAESFSNSNIVILCPIYSAGEKKDSSYNQNQFAKMISKYSNNQVIVINDELELKNYLRKKLN